ncbi:murein L,D-transpeptidase [Albirhodobacter sp. R86504]|jgi:murein L,D-transpeptidase YcbB/YkuD|uniref:L,D-transpeptidase family protein n=1 Tax=Albirhodobacter sp. R86504 TaxID=3093848 RepID=UPI00366F2787
MIVGGLAALLGTTGINTAALAQTGVGPVQTSQTQVATISGFKQAIAEAAAVDTALADFYAARDYQPIWTTAEAADRRAAFFTALDRAGDHGLPLSRYDAEGLRAQFAAVNSERGRGKLEAQMSLAYLAYAQDLSSGVLTPAKVDPTIVREITPRDHGELMTGLAGADPARFLASLGPQTPQYAQLQNSKMQLEDVIARGGWGPEVPLGKLAPGAQGKAVVALRNRLQALGYLGRSATAEYSGEVQSAVQQFQIDMGLTSDGIAGESTLQALNVGPQERLQSVLVAMERLRWMNGAQMEGRYIWVNLPDFNVRIFDDHKMSFESVTVIGQNQGDRKTPEFSDEMEVMVINPTWHIPRSITVKEYLPMMQRNANAAGHLKIYDSKGREVSRGNINFAQYSARTFPYVMKQPPSDGNALGLVKFLFPNKYNIYLHDTPSKSLFTKEVRAFSHGCVRVQKPFEFAYALLGKQSDTPEKDFTTWLNSGRETTVKLEQKVPVHIVYFTAYPSVSGRMEYRRDIYGRDAMLWAALNKAGVEL